MTHPLTDKICDKITDELSIFSIKALKGAPIEDCMRAAADWQLEQVIEWLEEIECSQIFQGRVVFAEDLKQAMRPQENNNV